ncbi:unannotated protein [freshwater metagenome]|uniref:Unannotated protein n=1 Tax=freshwater metagenome TaxID=449393 RepID=A0A6J6X147_9ZZZZ
MARGGPYGRGRKNGGVQADDIVAKLDHRAPPGILHIPEQEYAEGAVVVGGAESPVNFSRREDESSALSQINDLV